METISYQVFATDGNNSRLMGIFPKSCQAIEYSLKHRDGLKPGEYYYANRITQVTCFVGYPKQPNES